MRNGVACFALVLVVLAVFGATLASGAVTATNAAWGQGVRAQLPTGASGGSVAAVSCPAAGACGAVGTFTDSAGDQQALLLSESDGSWEPQAAVLPADAAANPEATLDALSCASPGYCTAVGNYADTAGNRQGLIVSESAGSWSPAVTAPVPSGALATKQWHTLASVACPTAATCVAVGTYWNAAGDQVGLLETEGSGGFVAQDVALSAAMAASSGNSLTSVSCLAAGDCTAVGAFTDQTGEWAMVVDQRSGAWQPAVPAPLPAGATPNLVGSVLDSVSCSSGSCTAVGQGYDAQPVGSKQALMVGEADGSLQAITVPPVPAGTAYGALSSVSCSGQAECAAVGSAGQTRFTSCCEMVGSGLLLGESGGSWTQTAAMMPADAASPTATNDTDLPLPVLDSVSCQPGGACSGGGSYEPAGEIEGFWHANAPLLINRSGAAWGSGFAPALPADAASGPFQTPAGPSGPTDVINAVSCATAGTCVAGGSYTDTADNAQPLLVSSTPGSEPSSLALQAPSTATSGSAIAGASVTATLSSRAGPTGTISFRVFGPSDAPPATCSSGGTPAGTVSVSGVGAYSPSAGFTPTTHGTYWWYAAYSGDDNAQPSASVCGAGMPATVAAASPPVVKTRTARVCSRPTGRITASAIGPIALGITRKIANRRLTHHTGTTTAERFCLTGGGATHVLYASTRLLARMPANSGRRLVGRAVLVLTASPHYALGRIKIGTPQQRALRALKLSRPHRVGKTAWYLSRVRRDERVIKIQGRRVTEIGVVNPIVLTHAGWRAVLRGF